MGQANSLLACVNSRDDREIDLKEAKTKATKSSRQLVGGVSHYSSPWPDSCSEGSVSIRDEINSDFDIMSPSKSREKEMGVMRNNEILDLVSSGDIEGLDFCIKKWHLHYNDVMIENAPILHCAVESMQLPMIQFLISVGVDIHARNKDGRTAYDLAVESTDMTIRKVFQSAMINGKDDGKITVLFDFPPVEEGDDLFSEPLPPSLSTSYETYDKFPLQLRKIYNQLDDAVSPLSQSSKATSHYSSILVKSEKLSPSNKIPYLTTEHHKSSKIEESGLLEVPGTRLLQKEEITIDTINIEAKDDEEEDDCPSSPLDDRTPTKHRLVTTDSILSKSTKSSSFETAHTNKKLSFHSIKKGAYKAFGLSRLLKKTGLLKSVPSTHQKSS